MRALRTESSDMRSAATTRRAPLPSVTVLARLESVDRRGSSESSAATVRLTSSTLVRTAAPARSSASAMPVWLGDTTMSTVGTPTAQSSQRGASRGRDGEADPAHHAGDI